MKKIYFIFLLSIVLFLNCKAFGQWQGSPNIYYNNSNVGIGTNSPLSKLHIYNTSGSQFILSNGNGSLIGQIMGRSSSYDANPVRIDFDRDGIWAGGNYPTKISFWTTSQYSSNPLERMKIDNTGMVWIGGGAYITGSLSLGTLSSSYKLNVNGTIRAKEIIVETDWSDFVFEKGYTLKSLEEVEQFIKENKHLPDIPSADEVEKNGVSLGEMQSKLLQKIEELTLYIINQEKRIRSIECENLILKKLYYSK